MTGLLSIDNADFQSKTVLVRADLNVPLDENGRITDATRIARFVPSVRLLCEKGAKVVVLSHLGRPKGEYAPQYSLKPVAEALAEHLGAPVAFGAQCIEDQAKTCIDRLNPGEVALLENLRFHKGETDDDAAFARALASLADAYVNDAFSTAHRAHASTHALAHLLPCYAGPSLLAEVQALKSALENPRKPVVALVGGAKVSTKISVLENLLPRMDAIIVGGGMANTFLLAQGHEVAGSLVERDFLITAQTIMARAKQENCALLLPVDVVVAKTFTAYAEHSVCKADSVPCEGMILDVGAQSVSDLNARLEGFKTLLWNGPLGAFELAPFGEGTFAVARKAAELTRQGRLVTVAGGGDTVAALNAAGVTEGFSYVSTAGGAFLEWLEGKPLPGIAVLER